MLQAPPMRTLIGSPGPKAPALEPETVKETVHLVPEGDSWYARVETQGTYADAHGLVPVLALLNLRDRVLDLRAKRRLAYHHADAMLTIVRLARQDIVSQQRQAIETPAPPTDESESFKLCGLKDGATFTPWPVAYLDMQLAGKVQGLR